MKKILISVMVFLTACQSQTANQVNIVIDKTRNTVKVAGIADVDLLGMRHDTLTLQAWQSLFPVCAMSADTDMRNYQPPIMGAYQITGNYLVFKPDTPFKSGQTYFARYYRYDKMVSAMDIVLHKRALGKAGYSELIFKY